MTVASSEDCLEFVNRGGWRQWLQEHHAIETHAWLIIYKVKYRDQGLALSAAVEEALCFGWIDGTLRPIDEKCYALRFSPRRPGSIWSTKNIQRVEKLLAEGKMTGAGKQKVAEAKENGQWEAAIRRERVDIIPEELEIALRKEEGALAAYQALPDSRKKQYIYWLQSAKRTDTKRKRIQKILDELLGN